MTPERSYDELLREALQTIRRLKAELAKSAPGRREPVAVVGLGCRLPGGPDPQAFWAFLDRGGNAVRPIPPDRWDADAWYDPDPSTPGRMYVREAALLDRVDEFDADFFNIVPREAQCLDPQQRLLLEVCHEALEDAALPTDRLDGVKGGVFVGLCTNDYATLLDRHVLESVDGYVASGTAHSMAAGRIAYHFGLRGPAVAFDTACSSSLVALHHACQSLNSGESDLALAAGVNVILAPEVCVSFCKSRMLAVDGRCKTFDAAADGFVRGEGCAVVVLKRLADARRDGDRILAVISGTALNQDGHSQGITAPNGPAQQRVIRDALAAAGVTPADVVYVEAHGTGTQLGDPIEVQALGAALAEGRPADRPLLVGSVKTNIGHTEAAAGVAGLAKVILALQHDHLPPHLHFRTPNPHIAWGELPVRVTAAATAWPADRPRIAGLSSFGFSGTNGHVVLEAGPAAPEVARSSGPQPILLSARTADALRALAGRYADWLAQHPDADLADVGHTAWAGRCRLEHRLAVVGARADEVAMQLRAFADGRGGAVPHRSVRDAARATVAGSTPAHRAAEAFLNDESVDSAATWPTPRRKLGLPTYPFQRQRHWAARLPATPPDVSPTSTALDCTYGVAWSPVSLAASPAAGAWLVIGDGPAIAPLADGLQRAGTKVTTLAASAVPDKLADALRRAEHVAYVTPELADQPMEQRLQQQMEQALAVAQGLALAGRGRLRMVTRSACPARPEDVVDPVHAALAGFGRTFGIEHPDLWAGLVDRPAADDAPTTEQVCRALLAAGAEEQLAVRGPETLAPRLVARPLSPTSATLSADGAYLVTGGLGGLGLIAARWLVERGARRIVLVGRRGPQGPAVQAVRELEQAGATVWIRSADLAQPGVAERLVAEIEAGLGPLHGVIHAAGVLRDAVLLNQDAARLADVLRGKALGAWRLHEAIGPRALDFFVLYSSISGVLGSAGQAGYAAANAFLDGLAHLRRAKGLAATSLDWGPWADAGMAADLATRDRRGWEALVLEPLAPATALAALSAAIAAKEPQVLVQRADWARVARAVGGRPPAILAEVSREQAPQDNRTTDEAVATHLPRLPADQRRPWLRARVHELAAQVLQLPIEKVRPDVGLFDLGMDSLMALDLRNRLQRLAGDAVTLTQTTVIDHPTVERLTDLLAAHLLASAPAAPVAAAVRQEEPIAVVGVGCQFPGAAGPQAFWQLLLDGRDAIADVPPDRWDADAFYSPDPDAPGRMVCKRGGFLPRVDLFDPEFFGLAPLEATSLDPQHRLLLETCWQALEHAAIAPAALRGSRTGVFMGLCCNDYAQLVLAGGPEAMGPYFASGNAPSAAAGRISYLLGLHGPSLVVDTACSSSLVAVHQACQAIRAGECDAALAGGVNVILNPLTTVALSRARMLAPDARCKTFDASADGYVRSEGCGVVVLKRLSAARRDGDRILAVIRGSAVNQDGASGGLTVPNGPAQEQVIAAALAQAGARGVDVGYVEAHGTGTKLGDPIELQALAAVLSEQGRRPQPLWVGAVKSNIGHLEAAAGVAGLIKAVLALHHGRIPGQRHFHTPNPHVAWDRLPVRVANAAQDWPAGPRLAGVSSFGFSGTNAHVVLEAAEVASTPTTPAGPQVLVLSARTPAALREHAAQVADWLERDGSIDLHDACGTLAVGRSAYEHRLAVVAGDTADAVRQLRAFVAGAAPGLATDVSAKLAGAAVRSADLTNADPTERARRLAAAWLDGQSIDWCSAYAPGTWRAVDAPTYPFQRQRYWVGTPLPFAAPSTGTTQPSPVAGEAAWRDLAGLAPAARLAAVRERVQALVQHLLQLTRRPEPHARFAELGLDSLQAVQLRNRVQQATGLALPATLAIEQPTIDQLAAYVVAALDTNAPDEPRPATPAPAAPETDKDLGEGELVALLDAKLDELTTSGGRHER